jgi:hypothetical protein
MQDGGYLYAKDLIDALKKKHAAKSYKKMVCFFECYCFVWMNRKINSSNRCTYSERELITLVMNTNSAKIIYFC